MNKIYGNRSPDIVEKFLPDDSGLLVRKTKDKEETNSMAEANDRFIEILKNVLWDCPIEFGKQFMDLLIDRLPTSPAQVWTDGEQLLTKDINLANIFADFFYALGFLAATGYYDPEEDERDGLVNAWTGFYYISLT